MPIGYVALLDVLGFSALVAESDKTDRLDAYLRCLEEALGAASSLRYVVFSDTIVLTTETNSPADFQELVQRCSTLLGLMLEKQIALRGAIAHGSYFRKDSPGEGVFIAGRAVVDAYDFERKQDWVGIMIAPSAIKQNSHLAELVSLAVENSEAGYAVLGQRFPLAAFLQPCNEIPFHKEDAFNENNYDGFAVVPTLGPASTQLATIADSLGRSLQALDWLKSLAPDPRAQAKYNRCMNWLGRVARQWAMTHNFLQRFIPPVV